MLLISNELFIFKHFNIYYIKLYLILTAVPSDPVAALRPLVLLLGAKLDAAHIRPQVVGCVTDLIDGYGTTSSICCLNESTYSLVYVIFTVIIYDVNKPFQYLFGCCNI